MNNVDYVVPMSVEEPSIIAAVSSLNKLVAENGGFTTYSTRPLMIGQIHVTV